MFLINKFKKIYKQKIKKIKSRYNLKLKQEREKYISILNHDIKTPLLAQIQSLELLHDEKFGEISPEQKEIVKA